jgi:chromosome segregation ATPase
MFEILEEANIDYRTLDELRKQRDSSSKTLTKLSEGLRLTHSGIEAKTELLKSLHTGYAVAERKIKDYQNDIFLLEKNCSDIVESAALIGEEFERKEKQLAHLERDNKRKAARITEMEKELRELPGTLSILEKEHQDLSESFKERHEVKQRLSDEISEVLSKASVGREDIESMIMELNNTFLKTISSKNEVRMRLSETETYIKELRETIGNLEQQLVLIEEVKLLQGKRKSVKTDVKKHQERLEQLDSEYTEIETQLNDSQEQIDAAIQKNDVIQHEMALLKEEVSEYDEALTRKESAQTERDSTRKMIERGLDELLNIFIYSMELNNALPLIRGKLKAIGKIL